MQRILIQNKAIPPDKVGAYKANISGVDAIQQKLNIQMVTKLVRQKLVSKNIKNIQQKDELGSYDNTRIYTKKQPVLNFDRGFICYLK